MIQLRQITSITETRFRELCDPLVDSGEGGASVGFVLPMTSEKAAAYWRTVEPALASGLALFITEDNNAIVGTVQGAPCPKENGKHRGEVQKLFVFSTHRGRHIATQLMNAAEEHAVALGLRLLVLDTHEGGNAETIYQHLGWKRCGVIPDFAVCPDWTLHGTALYCKRLKRP